jgi:predicted nucleotidyltransferase
MADSAIEPMVERFLAELEKAGAAPQSAVLHGSAARNQHIPGWSDINLLLIFERLDPPTLAALREPLRRWLEQARALPLMLTGGEWVRSADCYPLEIADMRTGYRVLRGADPVLPLRVRPADLRAALEREFRGKLLRLRQVYALLGSEPEELSRAVRRSVAALLVLLRGLVVLTGGEVPADPDALARAAGQAAGFNPAALGTVAAHRGEEDWKCPPELMAEFIAAIEAAARFVDLYQNGEQA